MECQHFENGTCKLVNAIVGKPVTILNAICTKCASDPAPQQLNRVVRAWADFSKRKQTPIQDSKDGPGTELKKLLSWFHSPDKRKCKCQNRIEKMNAWGPDRCEQKIDTIARWLKHSARIARLPYVDLIARGLVSRAIRNSRRNATQVRVVTREHDQRWSVAITTAPRQDCTLNKCVESVRQCGWEPVIFAEPGSTVVDCETVWNSERKGVWHNWRQASEWCLARNTEFVMTVQDDALFHPESRSFANAVLWPHPDAGYLSLYTPQHYQQWSDGRPRPPGIYEVSTNSVWGAMALIFRPSVLRQLLDHPRAKTWLGAKPSRKKGESSSAFAARCESMRQSRLEDPAKIQNSDTAIGIILRKCLGKKLMYVSPSPVDHFAKFSSIGHGGNQGKRNAIYIADRTKSLMEQVNGLSNLQR